MATPSVKAKSPNFNSLIASFKRRRVLLIGDLIIDVHHFGVGQGISIEAPVSVGKEAKTVVSPGGAGLVAANLAALGAQVTLVCVAGKDDDARVQSLFKKSTVTPRIFIEPNRVITIKERFIINGKKVLRWNIEDSRPITKKTEDTIVAWFKKNVVSFDTIVLQDARHGMFTKQLAHALITESHRQKKLVYVDSQITTQKSNHNWYRGADLMTLNEKEAGIVNGISDNESSEKTLKQLRDKLTIATPVLKLGKRGSVTLVGDRYITTPGHIVQAVDAVGAGDAFLSVLAAAGEASEHAFRLANMWAALATTIHGTTPPTLAMLRAEMKRNNKKYLS